MQKKIQLFVASLVMMTGLTVLLAPAAFAQTNSSLSQISVQAAQIDENNPVIAKVLKPIIRVLSAGVGLVVIISLIIAGIQYSAARDNPQMVAAAKNRILMSLLALVVYIFGFAVLQWLVPSGVLF